MKTIHPAIAEHVMEENEKLREVLRCIADLPMDRCSTENDYRLSAAKAIALGALSQQAEPTDTYTAVDMATAAAQGFRDGQAAVEQAPAQDEQQPALPVDSEAWLQEWARGKFTYTGAYKPRVLGQLYGNTDWALARALHSAIVSQLHAPIAQTAPQGTTSDTLIKSAKALLALDKKGALAPHGIGGLAREVIEKLIARVERTTPQPEQSALSGKCWIEVIGGREGPSIYIGDGEIAHRLAGNKPWGGGTTLHRFTVDILELVREATALSAQGASK